MWVLVSGTRSWPETCDQEQTQSQNILRKSIDPREEAEKQIVQKLAISALQRIGVFMSHKVSLLGHMSSVVFPLQAAISSF